MRAVVQRVTSANVSGLRLFMVAPRQSLNSHRLDHNQTRPIQF